MKHIVTINMSDQVFKVRCAEWVIGEWGWNGGSQRPTLPVTSTYIVGLTIKIYIIVKGWYTSLLIYYSCFFFWDVKATKNIQHLAGQQLVCIWQQQIICVMRNLLQGFWNKPSIFFSIRLNMIIPSSVFFLFVGLKMDLKHRSDFSPATTRFPLSPLITRHRNDKFNVHP